MMAVNAAGTVISERGLLCRFLCHPMATFRSFQALGAFEELTYKPLFHKHLSQWGHVAEWLRNGLQNRVHQFNSGRGLQPHLIDFTALFYSRRDPLRRAGHSAALGGGCDLTVWGYRRGLFSDTLRKIAPESKSEQTRGGLHVPNRIWFRGSLCFR
jgi:hypothetical protein